MNKVFKKKETSANRMISVDSCYKVLTGFAAEVITSNEACLEMLAPFVRAIPGDEESYKFLEDVIATVVFYNEMVADGLDKCKGGEQLFYCAREIRKILGLTKKESSKQ